MTTSRRNFLRNCAGAIVAPGLVSSRLSAAPSALRFSPRATAPNTNRILVMVNIEGGYDALSMLPPTTGSAFTEYMTQRPDLGWDPASPTPPLTMTSTADFGLHPALSLLQQLDAAGDLAVVNKVGLASLDRSHFNAKDTMARARTSLTNPDPRGWLGRLADTGFLSSLEIMGVGVSNRLDFSANGRRPFVLRSIENFNINSFMGSTDSLFRRDILLQLMDQRFGNAEHRIVDSLRDRHRQAQELATSLQAQTANINLIGNYPENNDERLTALQDVAKLIKADVGTRLFYTASANFDTHAGQEGTGNVDKPTLTQRLSLVMQSLQAFIDDLKSPSINRWNDVAIVMYTEFGRRNFENETGGTDHGHGFHAFVMGGGIQGGMVGNPLTAADLQTSSGSLPVEIDYRSLFRTGLEDWLEVPTATVNSVFDDFTPAAGEPALTMF